MLQVENISKKYGAQQVLKGVSFSVNPGEIVGFLGPNGAGKSTTMKIITGAISADEGFVRINGDIIDQQTLLPKKKIGFLPEENPLYEEMYVPEYLLYVAGLYRIKNPQQAVKTVIQQTGLQPEIHKKIRQLSKGYKQRTGIAQAIINKPEVLILDEPASGLDPNQIDEINALLLSLSPQTSILFSSHTLSEVSAICTRIIILHQGIIVKDKSIGEIENLTALFKSLTKSYSPSL